MMITMVGLSLSEPNRKERAKVQEIGCQGDMRNLSEKGRTPTRRGAVVGQSQ